MNSTIIDEANNFITFRYTDFSDENIEAEISGTISLDSTTVSIEYWEFLDYRRLRDLVQYAANSYILEVNGGIKTFYPSLGFELKDKEANLWQYQR